MKATRRDFIKGLFAAVGALALSESDEVEQAGGIVKDAEELVFELQAGGFLAMSDTPPTYIPLDAYATAMGISTLAWWDEIDFLTDGDQ